MVLSTLWLSLHNQCVSTESIYHSAAMTVYEKCNSQYVTGV
jgi:hypothetical protein